MACGSEASDNDDATRVVREIRSATSIRGVKKFCSLLLNFVFVSSSTPLPLLVLLPPSMMIVTSAYLALRCLSGLWCGRYIDRRVGSGLAFSMVSSLGRCQMPNVRGKRACPAPCPL